MKQRAVFLDRDGTIMSDTGYLSRPDEVMLLPGAIAALQKLARLGWRLVLISNQSGVGRGYFTEDDRQKVHDAFIAQLEAGSVSLDGAYYCPHAPEAGCDCRKPLPGLLYRAAIDLNLELASCIMVGDKMSDVEAGQAAGCTAVLLAGITQEIHLADAVVPDLGAAADWIEINADL